MKIKVDFMFYFTNFWCSGPFIPLCCLGENDIACTAHILLGYNHIVSQKSSGKSNSNVLQDSLRCHQWCTIQTINGKERRMLRATCQRKKRNRATCQWEDKEQSDLPEGNKEEHNNLPEGRRGSKQPARGKRKPKATSQKKSREAERLAKSKYKSRVTCQRGEQ